MARPRVVVVNSNLARYPAAGGHWAWALQWLRGLADLDLDVTWLEMTAGSDDLDADGGLAAQFFGRLQPYGVHDRVVLAVHPKDAGHDQIAETRLVARDCSVRELLRSADSVWSLAGAVPPDLVGDCRHSVLIDVDPGLFQAAALNWSIPVAAYDEVCTTGLNVGSADCGVPTLNRAWHTFPPPAYLPIWPAEPRPEPRAPWTTVTHWNWGENDPVLDGRTYSTSKRLAYLRYVAFPLLISRGVELAADIYSNDGTGDLEVLLQHGWRITDPYLVADTPSTYRDFIVRSFAEICVPKAIYRELHTGWISDRSAAYLASGRPVLMEETGASDHLRTGKGLVTFQSYDELVELAREIEANYGEHAAAARRLAEEYLDSRKVLTTLMDRVLNV